MSAHKNSWYKEWHQWKLSHHFHVAMLIFYIVSVLLGSLAAFFPGNNALAATQNWTFDEAPASDYFGYNNTKINVSGSQAALGSHTPSTDWIADAGGAHFYYRKAITVTNNSGGVLTDYQVFLNDINTSFGTKLQDQCQDLRFTSLNGFTENEYWVESGCKTATTDIWLKAPSLAVGANTIYMYYGNSSAVAKYASDDASADAVFVKRITNVQGAWEMGDNAGGAGVDSSGNNLTSTLNGAAAVADRNSRSGKALNYAAGGDGVDNITVADNTLIRPTPGTVITLSAWARSGDNTDTSYIIKKKETYSLRIIADGTINTNLFISGGWRACSSAAGIFPETNTWTHIAVTYNTAGLSYKIYKNGTEVGSCPLQIGDISSVTNTELLLGTYNTAANDWNGDLDDVRVYNRVLSGGAGSEIEAISTGASDSVFSSTRTNQEYIRKISTDVSGTENVPTVVNGNLGSEEGYYYNDYPTIQNAVTGNGISLSYISAMTINTGGTGYTRFQISPDNGTTWYRWDGSSWVNVADPDSYAISKTCAPSEVTTNIGSFRPGGANPRNFRWRAFLVSDGTQTATITDVSITYVTDTAAPDNPVIGGVTCYESDGGASWTYNPAQLWHKYSAPKFTWTAPSDNAGVGEEASGVWRYYAKLTTDAGYTPTSTDATTNPYLVASGLTNGQTYYLRVKTIDNAENESAATTLLTYKYDNVAPSAPSSISVNTLEYTSNPVTVTWSGAADSDSGIDKYKYQKYTGDVWTDIAGSPAAGIVGQQGTNTFKVKTVDVAGNESATTTDINYYYTLNAPDNPPNLQVDEQTKSTNSFTFTWNAPAVNPVTLSPIAGYYYSINTIPLPGTVTQVAGSTPTGNSTGAIAAATKQGVNTFYVVAYDSEGRVNYSDYSLIQFQVTTTAPNLPDNVVISDVSDRHNPDHYALALSWKAPTTGATVHHYNIRRTTTAGLTDGQWQALPVAGTTTTPAYAEANLTQNQMYYYRISALDNAAAESVMTPVISKAPTGRYIEPPTDTAPTVAVTATSATVTWTTDRVSYSKVEYGKTASYGMQNSSLQTTTTHSVTLYGLDPGTLYHYRTQSLDPADQEDYNDNDAYSGDLTFATQPAPGISDVKISDIRLDSVIVSWKTTSSATSTLRYGKTNAYGKELTDSSGSAVTTHTVKLSGLDHSSTYHFKVFGSDTDGNTMQSDDYNFDTLTFPKISNVNYQQLKGTATSTLKATWESNVPVSSTIRYTDPTGKTLESSQSDLVTNHEMVISGLKDNTEYVMVVSGRDAYGNQGTSGSEKVKTDFDTRPPFISEITTETSMNGYGTNAKAQMIVSWYTDEPSTSQVEYAEGVSGDSYTMATKEDSMLTTSHVVVVSDLDPSSSYYFRVISKDTSKNEAKSGANSALTEEARSSIFDIVIKSFESTLGWLFGGGR